MNLQDALDIAHDIRERCNNVEPHVVRTSAGYYIIGLWKIAPAGGVDCFSSLSAVLSTSFEYEYFWKLARMLIA
jgi:hypothetical protein